MLLGSPRCAHGRYPEPRCCARHSVARCRSRRCNQQPESDRVPATPVHRSGISGRRKPRVRHQHRGAVGLDPDLVLTDLAEIRRLPVRLAGRRLAGAASLGGRCCHARSAASFSRTFDTRTGSPASSCTSTEKFASDCSLPIALLQHGFDVTWRHRRQRRCLTSTHSTRLRSSRWQTALARSGRRAAARRIVLRLRASGSQATST